jgi:threonyl-tRNA synthetase
MLGSIERFMGVLIEHYGGALPPWLAPIQAVVIPIADRHIDYAMRVREQLAYRGLRIEVDAREDRMNAKIRSAQIQKVPYMLIVGDRESEQETVAVRLRSGQDLGAVPLKQVEETISSAVDSRKPA